MDEHLNDEEISNILIDWAISDTDELDDDEFEKKIDALINNTNNKDENIPYNKKNPVDDDSVIPLYSEIQETTPDIYPEDTRASTSYVCETAQLQTENVNDSSTSTSIDGASNIEATEINAASNSMAETSTQSAHSRTVFNKRKDWSWRKKEFSEVATPWLSSLPDPPQEELTPLSYFKMFIDNDIINLLSVETNVYAHKSDGTVLNVTPAEIEIFFGMLLHMGIVSMPNSRMYWQTECRYAPVADSMSKNRFEQIKRYLHIADNALQKKPGELGFDKLFKVRPLLNALKKNMNNVSPEEMHSVDEQIIPFKGRSCIKQYNRAKPHKWGFKVFTRAGVSGIMYDFEVYVGKGTCPEYGLGFSGDIVMHIVKSLPHGQNYKVHFDNWFTSLNLAVALKEMQIWCVGTIRADRTGKCPLLSEKELQKEGRGSIDWRVEQNNELVAVRWLDRKAITLVSTYCGVNPKDTCRRYSNVDKKKIEVPRPCIVKHYNKFMGGVDLADMLLELYRIDLRSKKWYTRIVYWCLGVAVVNGWLLYRRHQQQKGEATKYTLLQFQSYIATGLTSAWKTPKRKGRPSNDMVQKKKIHKPTTRVPISDIRFDQISHFPEFSNKKNRCKLCIQGITKMSCTKCNVHLCLTTNKNCFVNFHKK